MLETFNDDDEFCPIHLINHHFFDGSECTCPKCRTQKVILWKQMSINQKYRAYKLFNEMRIEENQK